MLTNKDIRVENGNIVINGDKYPLDGQSPEAIMDIVKSNSDTTPTENSTAPITSGGVFTAFGTKQDTLTFDTAPTENSTNPVESGGVYSAITALENLKVANVSATMNVATADPSAIGGYRTSSNTTKALSTFTGYPTGKTVVATSLFAYGANGAILGVIRVDDNGWVYLNTAATGDYTVHGYVFYKD